MGRRDGWHRGEVGLGVGDFRRRVLRLRRVLVLVVEVRLMRRRVRLVVAAVVGWGSSRLSAGRLG